MANVNTDILSAGTINSVLIMLGAIAAGAILGILFIDFPLTMTGLGAFLLGRISR